MFYFLLFLIAYVYCHQVVNLEHENMVILRGPIDSTSSSNVIDKLLKLKSKEIYIYINSPGGSIFDGLQIVQVMESLQQNGIKVYTIADFAASMAYIIHQCGTERYVRPWGVLMQHQMSLSQRGQYFNLQEYNKLITHLHDNLVEKQARLANKTVNEFIELTRHDWWLIGEESISFQVSDKVVSVQCLFKADRIEENKATIFGDVTLTYSSCPLSRSPLEVIFKDSISPENYNEFMKLYDTDASIQSLIQSNNKFSVSL
jgi:ATP-dependent Clp protease protease subunit